MLSALRKRRYRELQYNMSDGLTFFTILWPEVTSEGRLGDFFFFFFGLRFVPVGQVRCTRHAPHLAGEELRRKWDHQRIIVASYLDICDYGFLFLFYDRGLRFLWNVVYLEWG